MRLRTLASATALAVVALTAGCGGDEEAQPPAAAPATSPDLPAEEVPSAPATDEEPAPAATGGQPETAVLVGTVGEPDDPDAFTITLTDSSGEPVESVPPGNYTIQVNDLSSIHNFHLTGPGVEEATTVPETGEATWDVTLEAGTYTFVCDPHPTMVGEVTVS